jgi:hypothetical protein
VANNCYTAITLEGPEAEVDGLLRRYWDLGGKSNTTTPRGLIWRLPLQNRVTRTPNRFTVEGIVAWGVDDYHFERVSAEFPGVLLHVTWTLYERNSVGSRAYRDGTRIEDHVESLEVVLARHGYLYDESERWWLQAGQEPPHHFAEFGLDETKCPCLQVFAL